MSKYTTTKGNTLELDAKLWRGIRKAAMSRFDGSRELFNASWSHYRSEILPGTDDPQNLADVMQWLEAIAAEFVNDSESKFYIYG